MPTARGGHDDQRGRLVHGGVHRRLLAAPHGLVGRSGLGLVEVQPDRPVSRGLEQRLRKGLRLRAFEEIDGTQRD
jgi:hypothetical protein